MANEKNYYNIIGLSEDDKNLPFDEFLKVLKAKYRKACLKYHPDKYNGKSDKEKEEAEEKFKELTEAYSVLSDEEKKNRYDRFGTTDNTNFDNMDEMMEEFLRANGINPFGRSNRRQQSVSKGTNIQLKVRLTLKEIFEGGKKTVKYNRYKPCTHCNGTGSEGNNGVTKCPHCNGMGRIVNTQYNGYGYSQTITICPYCNGSGEVIENPCTKCNGSGLERMEEKFTFEIPQGFMNGQYTVISGMGNCSERNNGLNGDLVLIFIIEDSDGFFHSDDTPFDIYIEKEVPILDCITGCECVITNIDGRSYKFKVKPNTENETVMKLQYKGLPNNSGGYGDLRVVIKHKFPKEISEEEGDLLQKLKACRNFKE